MNFFSVFILVVGGLIGLAWYAGDTPQFFERTILKIDTLFSDEKESEHSYAVKSDIKLSISNINGPITILGHNKNELKVLVTKKGNAKDFDNIATKIEKNEDFISFKTIYNKHYNQDAVVVTYQVFAPYNSYLKLIENINGSINIGNINSDMIIKNVNGSITIDNSQSSVYAETINGKITLTVTKLNQDKKITLSSVNGSLESFLPQNLSADIIAETLVGTISSDFNLGTYQKKFTGKQAQGSIGSKKGGSINLKITRGKIDIHKKNL